MKYYDILWDENPGINQKLAVAFDQIISTNKIFPQYGKYGNFNSSLANRRPLGFKFSNELEDKIKKILKKLKVIEYFKERTAGEEELKKTTTKADIQGAGSCVADITAAT
ncbi:MAG: hypothetical protein MUD12_11315 [Spirochaetes bacterium]|jgi:hypothetical protein|nr:hypothetical protein [Spirochaetota bacterium]